MNKKVLIIIFIGIGVMSILLGCSLYILDKLVTTNQKNKPTQDKSTEQLNGETISDDEAKKIFKATEIISNNLPKSIEFWTEAYCTGSEYLYKDPQKYAELNRSICVQGITGSHGGCKTCAMAKISFKKFGNLDNYNSLKNSLNYFGEIKGVTDDYDWHKKNDLTIDLLNNETLDLSQLSFFNRVKISSSSSILEKINPSEILCPGCELPDSGPYKTELRQDTPTYREYNNLFKLNNDIVLNLQTGGSDIYDGEFGSGNHLNGSFEIYQNNKKIDSGVMAGSGILVFSFNYKADTYYFLTSKTQYNKGCSFDSHFYYVNENGNLAPVKNSWGGTMSWHSNEYDCPELEIFADKNHLYLYFDFYWNGEMVQVKNGTFFDKVTTNSISLISDQFIFNKINSTTATNRKYIGACTFEISKNNINELKSYLPSEYKSLDYGFVIANENLCQTINPLYSIFSDIGCVTIDACKQTGVINNSPASKAGLSSGDIILEINGEKASDETFENIMLKSSIGDNLDLKIIKNGSIQNLNVKIEGKPIDAEGNLFY